MGFETLSSIVVDLHGKALATSSKKSYKSGTNHFKKFIKAFPKLEALCIKTPPPSLHILTPCFFAASQFLRKSIKSANTIKSYVRHVENH